MTKALFNVGERVWPTQEWADKNGEIECGIVTERRFSPLGWFYDVYYFSDDFIDEDIKESFLSKIKPRAPDPNNLLKQIL